MWKVTDCRLPVCVHALRLRFFLFFFFRAPLFMTSAEFSIWSCGFGYGALITVRANCICWGKGSNCSQQPNPANMYCINNPGTVLFSELPSIFHHGIKSAKTFFVMLTGSKCRDFNIYPRRCYLHKKLLLAHTTTHKDNLQFIIFQSDKNNSTVSLITDVLQDRSWRVNCTQNPNTIRKNVISVYRRNYSKIKNHPAILHW